MSEEVDDDGAPIGRFWVVIEQITPGGQMRLARDKKGNQVVAYSKKAGVIALSKLKKEILAVSKPNNLAAVGLWLFETEVNDLH